MAEKDYDGPTKIRVKDMKPGDMWGTNRTTPGDKLPASQHPYPTGLDDSPRPVSVRLHSKGGMVKAGSPKVTAKCSDTKSIKC